MKKWGLLVLFLSASALGMQENQMRAFTVKNYTAYPITIESQNKYKPVIAPGDITTFYIKQKGTFVMSYKVKGYPEVSTLSLPVTNKRVLGHELFLFDEDDYASLQAAQYTQEPIDQ